MPELWGGSADLAGSNLTTMKGADSFEADTADDRGPYGRTLHFGIREHAMGSALNGIALHGGTRPYGGTFLVFSDYMRPPVRLAALMQLPTIYVWTHDSIGLGGDGPTHQPIEHLSMLRAVPHLTDFRPADANETVASWRLALERKQPAFMALSRQNLPVLDPENYKVAEGVRKGAYVLQDGGASPDVLLVAAGAEVWPVLQAAADLKKEGISARVISMPSFRIFEEQPDAYKKQIFPDHLPALAVEAGAPMCWWKYVGRHGDVIGLERFGASSPGPKVLEELGFSPANITKRAKQLLERVRPAATAGKA
jgi:transketolase